MTRYLLKDRRVLRNIKEVLEIVKEVLQIDWEDFKNDQEVSPNGWGDFGHLGKPCAFHPPRAKILA